MARLLIVYATTERQTRKVAEWLGQQARERGHEVVVHDAATPGPAPDPAAFDAAIVAASVHVGHHQTAAAHYVRQHRSALEARPSAFLSVSLSAAGDEDDRQDARECAGQFLAHAGWRPQQVELVSGAFRFTQYDFFRRWIMRRIAREKGEPTEGDKEYTDWAALGRFLDGFLAAAS